MSIQEGGGTTPAYKPLEPVQCVSFMDSKERLKNMRWAFRQGYKRLPELTAPTCPDLAIVAGGPSLNATYKEVSKFKDVMVCGSTHDHAIRLGIKPTLAIECDPDLKQVQNYKEKSDAVYLVASRCHRSLFNHLKGREIRLWHMWESELGKPPYNGEPAFICGATVVLAAIPVAITMGYKHLHFFGFDSSFESYENHHAYPQPEYSQQITVRVGDPVNGKEFKTTATWAGQAQQYMDMRKHWPFFETTIYGDSLMAEVERIGRAQ